MKTLSQFLLGKQWKNRLLGSLLYLIISLFLFFTLPGCFLVGIHVKVKNPAHAGTYPHFSESTKLLGNENTKYRNCFDATFYELNISIDEKKKYLTGTVKINATTGS